MNEYMSVCKELYNSVYADGHRKYKETKISTFVPMQGNGYMGQKEVRFMLVGRATNGWGDKIHLDNEMNYAKDMCKIFGNNDRYQKEWNIKNRENNPYSEYSDIEGNKKKYYFSKSAFWSTAHVIWSNLSNKPVQDNDWFENIVWNNLYKVAPSNEGNPSTNLIYAQASVCEKLLKEEIRILSPTHILLVVDESWLSWKSRRVVMFDFMRSFETIENLPSEYFVCDGIVQKVFFSNNIKVIVTCRPEKVSREKYIHSVLEAYSKMDKYKIEFL